MHYRQIILLASILLFLVSAGLYFFAPDLKDDLLSKGIRKVEHKKFLTLEKKENEIRKRIKDTEVKRKSPLTNETSSLGKVIEKSQSYLSNECDLIGVRLSDFPDLIDAQSRLYKNRGRVESVLNEVLGRTFSTLTKNASKFNSLKQRILDLDPKKIPEREFEGLVRRYEAIVSTCGLNNSIGAIMLTLSEVSEANPKYRKFTRNVTTNLALAYFSVESFNALFLGAGILRNMNTQKFLSKNETDDLIVLSSRLGKTYDNYGLEWARAKSVEEKKEVFRYYSTEVFVLAELFREFTEKVNMTN